MPGARFPKPRQKTGSIKSEEIYTRYCHDCGKPTNNYRCNECWEKKGMKPPHHREDSYDDFSCIYSGLSAICKTPTGQRAK